MQAWTNHRRLTKCLSLFAYSALAISAIGFLALPVWADCVYEGRTYRTSERVGSYVCMPDGSWQLQ